MSRRLVEEHLVGLQRKNPQQERSAVAQLEKRDLQLGTLAAEDRPSYAPVELERLASTEGGRHEGVAAGRLPVSATSRPYCPPSLPLPLEAAGKGSCVGHARSGDRQGQ